MKLSTQAERDRYCAFLQAQPLPLEVSSKPWKKTRSNEQNAYLWRAVYQPLVEVAGFTKDEWHEHFCGERFGWVEKQKPSGAIELIPFRTTTRDENGKRNVLKGDVFHDFVTWAEAKCAEYGVFVQEEWNG